MKRFLLTVSILISLFFLPFKAEAQGNQSISNGAATTAVNFPGTGCVYNWVNDTPGIGLAASGTGNIASFTAVNNGSSPVTATITATPVASGLAYIANESDGTVSVINISTNTVTATIAVGLSPWGVSVSPDGSRAYVTVSSKDVVITTVNVGVGSYAIGNFVTGAGCNSPPVKFTITVNPTPALPPTISASTATGAISACAGMASASPNIQQFTVSGNNLTGNITATAPTGFELSLNSDGAYGSTVIIPQTGGTASSTVIYVRSAASALPGSISGNVTLTSGSVSQTVAVTGTVNALPTVNAVASQTVPNGAATTAINFTGTGNTFTWVNDTPGIGLAASGTGDIASFTAVNISNSQVTATVTVTPVSAGSMCSGAPVTFTIKVNPIPANITATNVLSALSTIYGTPSVSANFTISGSSMSAGILVIPPPGFEVSSDNVNFSNTVTIGTSGTIASTMVYIRLASSTPVGNYSGNITLSSAGATNVSVAMPLSTVTPAPLTIIADNKNKIFGQINPVLTVTYNGFVNNDIPTQLLIQPLVATTAVTTSPPGQYPITASGAQSPNYTFTYVPGILTINPVPPIITVPNAFTPNGDGINDTWAIKYLDSYSKSTIMIYNRYGENVYSSIGYGIPWDGTYKGAALPTGTYYYIINLKNGSKVLSGFVAIIR